jgi:hypothetical protein
LRKVIHPQAHENYRVILKCEDGEFEIGSIGIQQGIDATEHWTWGIDTERTQETQGRGKDRRGECFGGKTSTKSEPKAACIHRCVAIRCGHDFSTSSPWKPR